jgi:predicted dehydrogenase
MASPVPLNVGVAGFGFWGTKLARNVAEASATRLVAVCDLSAERRAAAAALYPAVATVSSVDELLGLADLDAVVLATPEATHHANAVAALRRGKHVLVEKPLALSVGHCAEMESLAAARGLTLMVGHTFLYSAPVRLLRELVASGELGEVLYCYAQRLNLGAIRSDVSAMWDLAPHDLSILLHVLGLAPVMVSAQQFSLIGEPVEDVAMVNMTFPGGAVGHVHVSRLDPRKVRQLVVVGDSKMAVYDDLDPDMPLKVYDKGVISADSGPQALLADAGFARHHLELRTGDVVAPKVTGREPLREEIEHFAHCIATDEAPLTGAPSGRAVVAVLEAAQASSALGGQPVVVSEEPPGAYAAA